MAVDPFNSVNGYTVGIPPIPICDGNGQITAPSATIGNIVITGDQLVVGNVVANVFVGTFTGNISASGNITGSGASTSTLDGFTIDGGTY